MRPLVSLLITLLTLNSCLLAQEVPSMMTPQAKAEARLWEPGSSFFYINGIAYRYAAAPDFAVVAAATPGLAGKYLGVKVHVFNRSKQSITVRPEDISVIDAVANRRLQPIPAVDVVNRKRGQPGWMRFAGVAMTGSAPEPMADMINPQWSDLVRALQPEIQSSTRADAGSSVYSSQKLQIDGPDCDTACQLRNREVNSTLSPPGGRTWRNPSSAPHSWPTPFRRNLTSKEYCISPCRARPAPIRARVVTARATRSQSAFRWAASASN